MKSLILLLILAFLSPAQAQMSCMDLFNLSRPSEEQINTAIYDLAQLLRDKYSQDSAIRLFAKSESEKKFLELRQYLTQSEIRERLKAIPIFKELQTSEIKSRETLQKLMSDLDVIREFLEKNGLPAMDSPKMPRERVLGLAASINRIDIMKILLETGVDANAKVEKLSEFDSTANYTALMFAAEKGRIEALELLLQNGADINLVAGTNTALLKAVKTKNFEIVKLLIKNGANVNTNYGETPLMAAAEKNDVKVMELLIENGADIHATSHGRTALESTFMYSSKDAARLLRSLGATGRGAE